MRFMTSLLVKSFQYISMEYYPSFHNHIICINRMTDFLSSAWATEAVAFPSLISCSCFLKSVSLSIMKKISHILFIFLLVYKIKRHQLLINQSFSLLHFSSTTFHVITELFNAVRKWVQMISRKTNDNKADRQYLNGSQRGRKNRIRKSFY